MLLFTIFMEIQQQKIRSGKIVTRKFFYLVVF